MRPSLRALACSQAGLVTRSQALAVGYTEREIRALIRPGGPWVVVRHGIYVERSHLSTREPRDRWLLRDRAARMQARRPGILSHDSAARALGIRMLDVDHPGSHLLYLGPRGSRTNSGVTRHRDLLPQCIELVDDLVTTSYARTALDIGRLHGFTHGLVAVDSVRNMGVPLRDLEAELARMTHHPHIARARAAVGASDPGSESVLETLARELVQELDVGEVETQFAVGLAGGRTVWCDLRVGCHIFESDGFVKLVGMEAGGVATEPADRVLWKQQQRQTEICAEGLGMSRIVWADLHGPARDRARDRLRKEYAVTATRFGQELPEHLRRYADRHPRRRANGPWATDNSRHAA
ncbi:hypothetical protein [Nocardioides sp. 616]|uniref:hypothetical protein n=1 Tax=Nocardioides sp. 616 TaxID=2268090 RepID=UPI0013B41548|nr:hypothetical protein [Nocardioides sp. 616]